MEELKKNQIFEAEITGWTSDGAGVCRIAGRAVFVKNAIKGERVRLRIVKVTNAAVYAIIEELLEPSPSRIEPDCPHYGKCGGCALRHMSYEEELRFKLERVNDAYAHIGRLSLRASEIIGAERTDGYRNKVIYAVGQGGVCGFFRPRSHDIVQVARCLLQPEEADAAVQAVSRFMRENGVSAYDETTGRGLVRHIFVRRGMRSGEMLVTVAANGGFGALTPRLVEAVREACPDVTGIILNVNKSRGNAVLSGSFYTLWGSSVMTDELCGLSFSLSPASFYQINPAQAEKLYAKALEFASPDGRGLILDLYCGAGTISLCLARGAERVVGAEIVPEAVENARENAAKNGIENIEFICADAGRAAAELAARGLKPRTVVLDPPRKGLSELVIDSVCEMSPERVVYVSCNPATQARDLAIFSERGYAPVKAIAVDMFPRTAHVETVVLLSRETNPLTVEVRMEVETGEVKEHPTRGQAYGRTGYAQSTERSGTEKA